MRFERILVILSTLALLNASCDLLRTRDPQPPDGGNNQNAQATTSQMVLDNLQSAFANKNVNDYEKTFADTGSVSKQYVFVPTQKAAGNYSAIFLHWTKDSESNYFRKAMAGISTAFTPVVSFTNTVSTQFQSDSALYTSDYSVFIPPTTYVGHARFFMIQNKNNAVWVVYRWEDLPSGQDSTLSWSDLKGQFSQ